MRRCRDRCRSSQFDRAATSQHVENTPLDLLTSSSAEQLVQPEGKEWIWHLAQEPFQQRRKLNWILLGQIDSCRVLVNRLGDLL